MRGPLLALVCLFSTAAMAGEEVNCTTDPATNGIVCEDSSLVCTTLNSTNAVVCNDPSVYCSTNMKTNALECRRNSMEEIMYHNYRQLFNELNSRPATRYQLNSEGRCIKQVKVISEDNIIEWISVEEDKYHGTFRCLKKK